jgi:hypothetical protein
VIIDDSVVDRIGAGGQRCVSGSGRGDEMIVVALRKICSLLRQSAETLFTEERLRSIEQLARELIDHHEDSEPWRLGTSLRRAPEETGGKDEAPKEGFGHRGSGPWELFGIWGLEFDNFKRRRPLIQAHPLSGNCRA